MTHESKHQNKPGNNRPINSALVQLSELELLRVHKSVKALRKDLQLIHPSNDEGVEAVTAVQDLLKIWSDELDRTLATKQAKDTYVRLRNWDNEGGAVAHMPALSKTASEKQPAILL